MTLYSESLEIVQVVCPIIFWKRRNVINLLTPIHKILLIKQNYLIRHKQIMLFQQHTSVHLQTTLITNLSKTEAMTMNTEANRNDENLVKI